MSDGEKSTGKAGRPAPSGAVSSPRAYFGRASRAATGALRAGIAEGTERGPAAAPKRGQVYRAGDPALRLFGGTALPLPPTAPLTGAIATLSGIRDGEHERLLIDLGTSLVRATTQRDQKSGTMSLVLARTQSAETYGALLGSLRYVNDSGAPTNGTRRIVLRTVDGSGRAREVASAAFGVGEAPSEADAPSITAGDRIVVGGPKSFNTEGDFTLFWWPRRLLSAAERPRRAHAAAPVAQITGAHFSAGGRVYRVFGAVPEENSARGGSVERPWDEFAASAPAANDRARARPEAANDSVWTPGRGVPPPGFERARTLRLEDIFGSDMQDAIARRLLEHRPAANR